MRKPVTVILKTSNARTTRITSAARETAIRIHDKIDTSLGCSLILAPCDDVRPAAEVLVEEDDLLLVADRVVDEVEQAAGAVLEGPALLVAQAVPPRDELLSRSRQEGHVPELARVAGDDGAATPVQDGQAARPVALRGLVHDDQVEELAL